MRIYIENLTFSTIIGILEFERTTPQRVSIDIILEYSYQNRNYIDYSEVAKFVENEMLEKKFHLIEDALIHFGNVFPKKYPIHYLKMKITKPNILSNSSVAVEMEKNYIDG